jgi:hypothetical protein
MLPFLTILVLFATTHLTNALHLSIWGVDDCGTSNAKIRFLEESNPSPSAGCNIRRDDQAAISVTMENEADESVYIAFFDTIDCSWESRIGVLDTGCSGVNNPEDNPDYDKYQGFQSWAIYDTCDEWDLNRDCLYKTIEE